MEQFGPNGLGSVRKTNFIWNQSLKKNTNINKVALKHLKCKNYSKFAWKDNLIKNQQFQNHSRSQEDLVLKVLLDLQQNQNLVLFSCLFWSKQTRFRFPPTFGCRWNQNQTHEVFILTVLMNFLCENQLSSDWLTGRFIKNKHLIHSGGKNYIFLPGRKDEEKKGNKRNYN